MRRSIMFGLVGLVVVGVGAGTAVALTGDDPKTVSLKVDDQQSSVKTRAHTVEGVLSSRKLVVAQHDVIAPAVNTKIRNGTEIVLKRGRLLHLTIDGVERDVWTTAPTVAEALAELGYSTDDFSSVSRDKRLPLSPTDIELRTPKQVRVLHDGRNDSVTTTAATVRQLLTDLRITVNAADRLSMPASSKITNGSAIRLQRVVTKTLVEQHTIGYSTVQRQNGSMYQGETKVVTAGKAGTAALTYRMVYVDGKLTGKTQVARTRHRSPRHGRRERGHQGPAGTCACTCAGAGTCARTSAGAARVRRRWPELGWRCRLRVWRELVDQHREWLLRRAPVRPGHLARQRRWRLRAAP